MLKLGAKREPQRIVLMAANGKEPEAWVLLMPITGAMRRRSQSAMRRMIAGRDIDELDNDAIWDLSELASRELIRLGIVDWGGIFDADGKPVVLTPDRETRFATANDPNRPTGTIDQLLEEDDLFEKLDAEYVVPDAKRRAEKNGLSASPAGTGGAGTRGKGTASSAAGAKTAKTRRKTAAARNARTSSTRSRPKKPKASGRS